MRYLGSKVRLLTCIQDIIDEYNVQGEIFADLFSGTGCVGDFFKDKYNVISNDFLYYSSVMSKAKLLFCKRPAFKNFVKKYNADVFEWLNAKRYTPNQTYFVYNNYTPVGGRMFFTEENGIKIDGIRPCLKNQGRCSKSTK